MVAVKVREDTKKDLEKVKEALSKVLGRKVTYDFTVSFLIGFLSEWPLDGEDNSCRRIKEALKSKKEFFSAFAGEKPDGKFSETEIYSNFIYVPEKFLKTAREKKPSESPLLTVFGAMDTGLTILGRYVAIAEGEENLRAVRFLAENPDLKEQFVSTVQKRFQHLLKKTVSEFEKKARKKKR